MNLLKMSFSGALLILAIIIVRAIFINRLPKKTFLILWGIVFLRLLIPFSIPSAISVYSLIDFDPSSEKAITGVTAADLNNAEGKILSDNQEGLTLDVPAGRTFVDSGTESTRQAQIPQDNRSVSVWTLIWCAGGIVCAAFFIISYLRWRFDFRTFLPVSNTFVEEWLKEHQLRRPIAVRQSGRAAAPMTYGIFHPTILLPQAMDWENRRQLQYIFFHEYVHICRYDIVTKLIAASALCIHWFNPLVWGMYILFNRDIELTCDECVIRQFGENSKSEYALTLISMEERKSGLLPVYNNFSKNAIEERITAIMKIRKTSLAALAAAVVLSASVTTVFATSAADKEQDLLMPVTDFSEEDYEKLLALQFDGYEDMTVSEYQIKVWELTDTSAYRELLERFSKSEELYGMRDSDETASFLYYVLEPLTAEKWRSRQFDGYAQTHYSEAADNAVLEYIITLEILDANELTVGEYNTTRRYVMQDLNDIINGCSSSDLRDEVRMQEIIDEGINNIISMYGTGRLGVAIEYSFMPLGEISLEDMEEWEKERLEEWDGILAPYVPFGLTYHYDFTTDTYRMFFQGKEVRGIVDEKENIWITDHAGIGVGIYDKDAVELYAVYENGELAGLREGTAREQEEWSKLRQQNTDERESAQEIREHAPATEEDYKSLLALKTSDYRNRTVADFNRDLLEWADEDYERMERINTNSEWNNAQIFLDDRDLSFVRLTVNLSGAENAKSVQSNYTGRAEENPCYNQYLPEKTVEGRGMAAWCSLWYQFSYSIADKNVLTVGERDDCVEGMISAIEKFWDETDIEELLKMTEEDVVKVLREIAEEYSSRRIKLLIDEEQVQFECMDERNIN